MCTLEIRDDFLKTGDVLLCSGKGFMSSAIRFFTGSFITHTAQVIRIYDKKYIIDAQKDGINVRPINDWQKKYNYCFFIFRNIDPAFDKYKFSAKALSKSGITPYDYPSLIYQIYYQITKKWIGRTKEKAEKRMYCSEYTAWLLDMDEYWEKSPEDIYELMFLRKDYELLYTDMAKIRV